MSDNKGEAPPLQSQKDPMSSRFDMVSMGAANEMQVTSNAVAF